MIESTPVCGVEIRKDTVAPFDAPSFLSDMAVGMVPHEHSGSGMPNNVALNTAFHDFPPRNFLYIVLGTNACMMPASRKPSSKYGDISFTKLKISFMFYCLFII